MVTPLFLAFPSLKEDLGWPASSLDVALDIFFVFDLIFMFRTSFVDEYTREIVARPVVVWCHVIRRPTFILDCFASIPFEVIILLAESERMESAQLLKTVRLFRLMKLVRLGKLLSVRNEIDFSFGSKMRVMVYLLILMFIAHVGGNLCCRVLGRSL